MLYLHLHISGRLTAELEAEGKLLGAGNEDVLSVFSDPGRYDQKLVHEGV